ncbi:unnamed protein product [Cochlearia groenlandica]
MYAKRNPIRDISAARNSPPPPPSSVNVAVAHVRVGSYYEIDSSILPQRSPEQLKSIRVVMVSKITASDVSIRYPSMYSLRSHFDFAGMKKMNRSKPEKRSFGGLLPVFDESRVLASELAGDLLYRRIAPHEVSTNRFSWRFWVSAPPRDGMVSLPSYNTRLRRVASPEGKCLPELRSRGMIKWGKRMHVQYQSRHKEGEDISKEEDDHEAEKDTKERIDGTRKRKLIESRNERVSQRAKALDEKKETQIVVYERKQDKKFIDRWSVDRYKLAERNMLKVMKEKNAVFGNSILRSELRSEARKLIGDTGLLDHLLKHMAGKVAPGGIDRFRRKHNADGAMEYWLESSDLIHIREEAGVQDPYWTPPPGWKLGDSPSQDPVCAGKIREINEKLAIFKRELEKLASKKKEEEKLASKNKEEELPISATPNSCVTSQNTDTLMTPTKEIYADLLKKKNGIEEQLVIIVETLRKMEEDMGWLKRTVNENCPEKTDKTETPLLIEDSPKTNTPQEEQVNKENQTTESPPQKGKKDERQEQRSPLSLISKTGFRICKPVGSFSWPTLPALVVATHENDACDSAIASSPSHKTTYTSPASSPAYPVKPFAAKRPLVLPFPFTIDHTEAPTNLFNI